MTARVSQNESISRMFIVFVETEALLLGETIEVLLEEFRFHRAALGFVYERLHDLKWRDVLVNINRQRLNREIAIRVLSVLPRQTSCGSAAALRGYSVNEALG